MNKKLILVIVTLGVIVGSLLVIRHELRPPAAQPNQQPFVGMGQVMAEQLIRLGGENARVLLVVHEMNGKRPAHLQACLDALARELKGHPGVRIVATEGVPYDPEMVEEPPNGLTLEHYRQLFAKHPGISVVLSLIGGFLPNGEHWQGPRPKFLVFDPAMRDTKLQLQEGLLDVAIVPNWQPVTGPAASTPRGWFDRYFRVVTASEAAAMP